MTTRSCSGVRNGQNYFFFKEKVRCIRSAANKKENHKNRAWPEENDPLGATKQAKANAVVNRSPPNRGAPRELRTSKLAKRVSAARTAVIPSALSQSAPRELRMQKAATRASAERTEVLPSAGSACSGPSKSRVRAVRPVPQVQR